MKNDLSCEVVQDLLPSYVDGLTSEASKEAIERHMESCKGCGEVLSHVRHETLPETVDTEDREICELKKMNRRFVFCIALCILCAVFFTGYIMIYNLSHTADNLVADGYAFAIEDNVIDLTLVCPKHHSDLSINMEFYEDGRVMMIYTNGILNLGANSTEHHFGIDLASQVEMYNQFYRWEDEIVIEDVEEIRILGFGTVWERSE